MRMKGQVAVVTGSSRGIGRGIALAFAREGADVAVTYESSEAAAREVASEIESMGRRTLVVQFSVENRDGVRSMAETVRGTLGSVTTLVNNAGILEQKPFETITEDEWDRMMAVNLRGAFSCSQEFLPDMTANGWGRIINIASSGGQLGGMLAVHYATSKAGMISLSKSLARVGAPHVLSNCVSPGLIETEMAQGELESEGAKEKMKAILAGRPGTVDEVSGACVFLASEEASYITGQTINVNGGLYLG